MIIGAVDLNAACARAMTGLPCGGLLLHCPVVPEESVHHTFSFSLDGQNHNLLADAFSVRSLTLAMFARTQAAVIRWQMFAAGMARMLR